VFSYAFRHLAEHPEHRQMLIDNPAAIDAFVEEVLRYYSIVSTSRVVRDDVEFAGCPMRAGDRIVLSTTGANRDPRQFTDADQFIPDRTPNRHIAFGAGIHRCVGAPLARMELRVSIDEWLRVIPNFSVASGANITQHVGGAAGLDTLALEW
jgi:cytochrome P450